MRIGIVFHKDPYEPPTRIDLIRLRALSRALIDHGLSAEIIAPVKQEGLLDEGIPVQPLACLEEAGRYDLIKTCYHSSMGLIGDFDGPVAARIVRVVDERLPERDETDRGRLLYFQDMIHERANALILNNPVNADRWRSLHGPHPPITLIPNGCPSMLPQPGKSPYQTARPIVLFLGSLAAPRMVHLLNDLAAAVHPRSQVHHLGRNVAHLYGGDENAALSPLIIQHGEVVETRMWDYIRHARVGLALAAGPHAFDNDLSKVLSYLRGRLPVLSEEHVLNNDLILSTGGGRVFAYGDVGDMVKQLDLLLDNPGTTASMEVARLIAESHSWENRGRLLYDLIEGLLPAGR
ncbi:MAG: hypothetical protein KKB20_01550 [Proteobacteria bacterium]|nr:hypothetical protein [Pseudomonadota bacterium]